MTDAAGGAGAARAARATDGRVFALPKGPPSVGPGGLLVRTLGILLWRLADPASLPVPAVDSEPARAPRPDAGALGAATRVAAAAAALAGAALLAVALAAFLSTRSLVEQFAVTSPGTPLDETAAHLERSVSGAWWSLFYPSFDARAARAAAAIREGRSALAAAADAYEAAVAGAAATGPVGRLARGAEIVAPVNAALDQVATPWHRGTLAFREIREAVRPYAEGGAEGVARLRGTVKAALPGHALLVTLDDGRASKPLEVGDRLDIPLVAGAVVRLTDLARPSDDVPFVVVEDRELPMAAWPESEKEILFPQNGATFRVRLDDEWLQKAPPLPPLSASARAELDLRGARRG